MASKNERPSRRATPQTNKKRDRSVAQDATARERGATANREAPPKTHQEKRADANSDREISFRGPSGATEGRGGGATGQGHKRDTTLKESGTGGSGTQYGRKR